MNDSPTTDRRPSEKIRILIADDEESMRHYLLRSLQRNGYDVDTVESGEAAVEHFEARRFDVVLLDLKMSGMNGIEVLKTLRTVDPDVISILMTGYGSIQSAVDAMKLGAFDYLTKPFELDELLLALERSLSQRATVRENRELRRIIDSRSAYAGLIGQSPAMRSVYQTIDLVRETASTVLLHGESGTGKELVARAIHLHSRPGGEFVPIHCAALPGTLLESELFGHEPGAFTGATTLKRGLIERAHGGTLFLDEVSEIPLDGQVKFLRFLQERVICRLGSTDSVDVDVRVVAACNRDLEKEVEAGRFRDDLFWRLNVVPIHIPPLRERREDVSVLVSHFLAELGRSMNRTPPELSNDALIALTNHAWPGNVRELQNTIERLVVLLGDGTRIGIEDLPSSIRTGGTTATDAVSKDAVPTVYREASENFERRYMIDLIDKAGGNISQAARLSGLSRPSLHRKIKQLGLDADKFRE